MSIQFKETNSTPAMRKAQKTTTHRISINQAIVLRATRPHVMKAFTEKKEQFDAWLKNQSDPVRSARTRRWTNDADEEDDAWLDDRTT